MKTYSISGVSRLLEIDYKTLRRWILKKAIPAPKPGVVDGRLSMCWTEGDIVKIKAYKDVGYWGKGIDRKTGKKAKKK
jgi:hypothetical protein